MEISNFIRYKAAGCFMYAMSIASTWAWCPSIFVSSSQAHDHGLPGLLMFLVPNVLTLIIFAFVANKIRQEIDGFTLRDFLLKSSSKQVALHTLISIIVLCCSTIVQMIGIHQLLSFFFPEISKLISAITVSVLAFVLVGYKGIKDCIITDSVKYYILVGGGIVLLCSCNFANLHFIGIGNTDSMDLFRTFGLATFIGLISAPYCDATFIQRMFSIPKNKVKKTFILSAILFMFIPLIFGFIGFSTGAGENGWVITNAFTGINSYILALCVLSALLSTVDSNMCAISSYAIADFKYSILGARLSMIALLLLSSIIFIATELTIIDLFLIYGTIRTICAVPTLLVVFDKFNKSRLFYATCVTVIIAPVGYLISDKNVIFSIIALLLPLLGIALGKKSP